MNRISIPIHEILVLERQRIDYGDLDGLADSLSKFGLIQPVVINQENRLIAGGRRIAAATRLGWTRVDVVYRETLTADELHELELEENVQRKDMSWQERCLNIHQIHQLKQKRAAIEASNWGQRETGALLGISVAHINYCLTIAHELKHKQDSPLWQSESLADAWRVILRRKEDEAYALLKEREKTTSVPPSVVHTPVKLSAAADLADHSETDAKREEYYRNPHNPPGSFETYWAERKALETGASEIVYLSNRLHHGDALTYLRSTDNFERFDHIVTDPPYGIDMDMLTQENQGMVEIDYVEEEHQVEDNETLLREFFPAAYLALRQRAFCVVWCDITQWQLCYDAAIAAGFKVQRWPLVWVKAVAMNNAAQFNFTKNYELAMVCRKGPITLVKPQSTSIVTAGHDWMRKAFGHPFVKPEAVWRFILDAVSIEGQTILDPFAGRGSGILSTLSAGRHAFGVEKNTSHFNALLENVKQHYLKRNKNAQFK